MNRLMSKEELIADWKRAEQFRRVYQGGHHDVYCNGTQHVTLIGGQFGHAPVSTGNDVAVVRLATCDCAQYSKP